MESIEPEENFEIEESNVYISPEQPFDPTKINISIRPLVIDNLIKRLKSKPSRIDMNTDFQRLGNLWDEKKQSRLIESLLLRIPLPVFFFDGTNENDWKVVDGLQRLWSLKTFIIDNTLKLKNLEYLFNLNGLSFTELPEYLQSRIEETVITAHVINPGTPSNVKYNIFKRINTHGLTLYKQEIRHRLNAGNPANFLRELSEIESFQKLISNTTIDIKRMQDRELILHFICFYRMKENYPRKIHQALDQAMIDIQELSQKDIDQIKADFIKAIDSIHKYHCVPWIFTPNFKGEVTKGYRKIPIYANLFSIWMTIYAKYANEMVHDRFFKDASGCYTTKEYYYIKHFIKRIAETLEKETIYDQ